MYFSGKAIENAAKQATTGSKRKSKNRKSQSTLTTRQVSALRPSPMEGTLAAGVVRKPLRAKNENKQIEVVKEAGVPKSDNASAKRAKFSAIGTSLSSTLASLVDNLDRCFDAKTIHECRRFRKPNDLNGYSILATIPLDKKKRIVQSCADDHELNRAMGAMVGMAVGDLLGHPFEFQPVQDKPGSAYFDLDKLAFVNESNEFGLKRGQWTDDASMGSCMADSLLMKRQFDGSDIRVRFWCWWNRGYGNAFRKDPERSKSVGLGGNISKSLSAIEGKKATEISPAYEAKTEDAGNGSLMRLAPLALYKHGCDTIEEMLNCARASSYTTHPGILAAEACGFFGFLIVIAMKLPKHPKLDAKAFLEGATTQYLEKSGLATKSGWGYDQMKSLVNSKPVNPTERCWDWKNEALDIEGTLRARGDTYNGYPVSAGYFGAYALDGLAIALWSLYHTKSFDQAVVRSINLLGDADSHGSITGQLAGAFYGYEAINPQFLEWLTEWDDYDFALKAALLHHLGGMSESIRFRLRVKVVPYGVLGSSSEGKTAEEPDFNTAFVDPAGMAHVQPPGGPSGAGGAAGVIYAYLGISTDPFFPQPVIDAIQHPLMAKFHTYGKDRSKKCIHVVGPDFRVKDYTYEEALDELAEAYRNVFSEFCKTDLLTLRLLPISGGIFSGPFKNDLARLTAEAIEGAFRQLRPEQKTRLNMAEIKMCIFMANEVLDFEEGFSGISRL